jgi:formylmethanofuran dehydrogenase subunit B
MSDARVVAPAVCLGCGCACDDIAVHVAGGRITDAERACELGRRWFGDGRVPGAVLRGGAAAALDDALADAAALLWAARGRVLVYLAPDVSCEAQREEVAVTDRLRATVDGATSDAAASGLLAAQRRGRTTATLGEVRNRADRLVFWAVDPAERYPRFRSRYVPVPADGDVPAREIIAVDVGAGRGPADAGARLALEPADEIAALSVMRAVVLGRALSELPPPLAAAAALARTLTQARYAVLVHDAEDGPAGGDPYRAEALIALTQALNGPTRAALTSLRGGGNRSGAEAVLTWQSGFPFAVEYSSGVPRYAPLERGGRPPAGRCQAALVVGAIAALPPEALAALRAALGDVPSVIIGPRASESAAGARVAIDTGVAGIHEAGIAYRMDEVPLPLRPALPGTGHSAAATLAALGDALGALQKQVTL